MKSKSYLHIFVINIIFCSYNINTTPVDLVKEFLNTVQERNFDKAKKYIDGNFSDTIIFEIARLWKINPKSFKEKNNYSINLVKSTEVDALISISDEYNNVNITLRKKDEEWKIILKSAAIIDLLRGNTREEDANPEDYVLELGDIQEEQIINKKYSENKKITDEKIKRDNSQKKDEANVFYKSQYTLFDLYTDEPIFPDSKGIYNIYYASNEEKFPRKISITAKELESFGFYKFKNLENCSKWCSEGKLNDIKNNNIVNGISNDNSGFDTLSKVIRYTASELPHKLIKKDENYIYFENLKEISGKREWKDKVYLHKSKTFTGKALVFDIRSFYNKYKYYPTLNDFLISNFKLLDSSRHVLLFNSNKDTLQLSVIYLIKNGKSVGEIAYNTNNGKVGFAKYRETTNSKKFTKYVFFQDGTLKEKRDVTYEIILNYEYEIPNGDFVEYFEDGSIKAIGFLGGNTPGLPFYTKEEYIIHEGKYYLASKTTFPGIYRRGRPNFELDFTKEEYSRGILYRRVKVENEEYIESIEYFSSGKVKSIFYGKAGITKEFNEMGELIAHYDKDKKSLLNHPASSTGIKSSVKNIRNLKPPIQSKSALFKELLGDKCPICLGVGKSNMGMGGATEYHQYCNGKGCKNCNWTGKITVVPTFKCQGCLGGGKLSDFEKVFQTKLQKDLLSKKQLPNDCQIKDKNDNMVRGNSSTYYVTDLKRVINDKDELIGTLDYTFEYNSKVGIPDEIYSSWGEGFGKFIASTSTRSKSVYTRTETLYIIDNRNECYIVGLAIFADK